MVLAASAISWVLTISPVVPGSSTGVPLESKIFASSAECAAAGQKFMVDHQFTNWQGIKMNPLIRTVCAPKQ